MRRAALLVVFILVSCDDGGTTPPPTCGANTCNEANAGGTCDDSSGAVVCACNEGYQGALCDGCEAGFAMSGGACLPATCAADTCNETAGGADYDVYKLQLSVVHDLDESVALQLGGWREVAGRNAGGGNALFGAFWLRF